MTMLRLVFVVGCLAIGGAFTGAASAEPNADFAVTVTLYDCSGPAGTPASFQTEKIPVGGANDPRCWQHPNLQENVAHRPNRWLDHQVGSFRRH